MSDDLDMNESFDFSKATKNPYLPRLKKQITIRLDSETISYFKDLSDETGIKYQQLINLYLADCARKHKKIAIEWNS